MSDQVTITVHRRNTDGTWPPPGEPPEWKIVLAMVGYMPVPQYGYREKQGFVRLYCDVWVPMEDVLAWADVTEVLK